MSTDLRYDGRVAVVTGAGRGLGREYALLLAERGAKVVVNDVGCDLLGEGTDPAVAAAVVEEIRAKGGEAIADSRSVVEPGVPAQLVELAGETYGRLDILVNNVGGSRMFTAKTLLDRSPADIAFTLNANLASSMAMTIAAWPAFADQQYGRIVNISSASALGLLPAIDYSAGKAGIVGLTRSLAIAGPEAGVLVNAVMPIAFTRAADANMEGAALRDFAGKKLAPVLVAPIVAVLAHERCPVNGKTFSSAGGVVSSVDFCETAGHVFEDPTPEAILAGMDSILDQDGMTLAPTAHEQAASYMARLGWK